jgi:hypothetical protein
MQRVKTFVLGIALVLAGCVSSSNRINRGQLMGAWTSGGPSFDFDIRESTILYEFDMQEHPYTVEGDTLVIDFRSVSLGVQKKRIVKLTPDVLVLQDVQAGGSTEFHRMRP